MIRAFCCVAAKLSLFPLAFQALGIATKINKGTIEIVSDVHLIKTGDKVGASQATLLAKLGIKPFKYGLGLLKVGVGELVHDGILPSTFVLGTVLVTLIHCGIFLCCFLFQLICLNACAGD